MAVNQNNSKLLKILVFLIIPKFFPPLDTLALDHYMPR
jgi:hypothetical protein